MVDNLDGSEYAKKRVRVVLETLSGGKTIDAACAELGIEHTRLYELREQLLASMIESAEPGRPGRPRQHLLSNPGEVETLKQYNRELMRENQVLRARKEIVEIQSALEAKKKWRTRPATPGRGRS